MSVNGKFDVWLKETYDLIDKIREIGSNGFYSLKEYNSPYFSFYRNDGIITIKSTSLIDMSEFKTHPPTLPLPSTIGSHTVIHSVASISSNYKTAPPIKSIIITISLGRIISIKWVYKIETYNYDSEPITHEDQDGGKVRTSMLFLADNKIMVDGVIYSPNSPLAFSQDITDDNAPVRYLDLLDLREKCSEALWV